MQVAITVNKPFKLNLLKHKYAAEAVSTTEVEVKRNQNSFITARQHSLLCRALY